MRISDWSSDVCSSDLDTPSPRRRADLNRGGGTAILASPSPSSFRRDPQTMQMTGQYRIEAPRQAVWEALNDVEVLRQCIPGVEIGRAACRERVGKYV